MATLGPIIGESAAEIAEAGSDLRYRAPADLAASDAKAHRHQFLKDSLGNDARAEQAYERIIAGDELQSITYLQRGMIAARAVARIDLGGGGFGTGFLIAPGVLITNNHVLPDASTASGAVAQFLYELNLDDAPLDLVNYRLQPAALFHTSPPLDFTVVAVASTSEDGTTPLSRFGVLPLLDVTGKASEGEWLTIVQHPSGNRKQVCVRENQLLKRDEDVLWYSTDTMPGSSGSPVFNNDWYVVALHHSGVRETTNGVVQKNSDGSVRWAANEGIRASRIARALKQALPNHPLLQPLYAATPASARISEPRTTPPPGPRPNRREGTTMPETRTVTVPLSVTLQVQADGSVVPLSVAQATESTGGGAFVVLEKAKKKPIASFDAPFDDDYSKRDGYQPDFLEKGDAKKHVGLPKLGDALQTEAAPLLKPQGNNKYVLHYHNYSVVMHAKRRLAIYSAANVTFGDRFDMSRPPDVWRRDPRILAEHQLENWYYAKNNFDRGHLTRREDLEFGRTPKIALGSAGDTCHWTNCTPQHSQFNQNEETWHGIERHILETSIYNGNLNAQIITGPVLEGIDPEYKGVQFPLQYWKVVAALDSEGKLFATAYVASQEEVIDQFGIEVTEVPFGPYKTYQTKISEIERLTGLSFGSGKDDKTPLRDYDPLERPPSATRRRRRRRAGADESFGARIPVAYHEITQLEDIEV